MLAFPLAFSSLDNLVSNSKMVFSLLGLPFLPHDFMLWIQKMLTKAFFSVVEQNCGFGKKLAFSLLELFCFAIR